MLIFADESSWPHPSSPAGYAVCAAIAIDPKKSKVFSRETFLLKKKFWNIQEPNDFEIKGQLLLNRRALTSPKKVEFVEEIISLCKLHNINCFAIGLRNIRPASKTLQGFQDRLEFRIFTLLLERIEAMMEELYPDDMATMVFDTRGKGTDGARAISFGNFIYGSDIGSKLQRIVDTPLFVASEITVGIQVADLIAYAVAQSKLGRNEESFHRIYTKINEMEWKSNRTDVEYPLRGFRFADFEFGKK